MRFTKPSLSVSIALVFSVLFGSLLLPCQMLHAQDVWNQYSSAGNLNWSSTGNWGYNLVPTANDIVVFDIYGTATAQGAVNNVVDANFTVGPLYYDPLSSTNAWHTTQINPGVTLSLVPTGYVPNGNVLAVGAWLAGGYGVPTAGGANDQVYASIVGANGTLNINSSVSSIRIEQDDGTSGSHWATLDLSRLATFSASVSNVLLGANLTMTRPNGTLILAQTNTLTTGAWGTTTPGILLGCGGWASTDGGAGNLTLGQVNTLNVDWLAVGGHRGASQGTSTLGFGSITNGTLRVRGSGGGRAPSITIGDMAASDMTTNLWLTSRGSTGVAEFRSNTVDIMVDSMILGRNLTTNETTAFNTGATGVGTGTLNMDAGTLDINNLYLGYKFWTNYNGVSGTLVMNGGTMNVHNSVLMTYRTRPNGGYNGGNATATITIASNALANIQGDIVKGVSGQGTSTLNINYGGLVNMQRPGNVTVDSLTINYGTLQNVSNTAVSGTVALTGTTLTNAGGVLTAGTLTLNPGSTVMNISNISVSGTASLTGAGITNNLSNVNSVLTAGTLTLNPGSSVMNVSNISLSGTLNLNGGGVTNGLSLTAGTIAGNGTLANIGNVTNSTLLLPGATGAAGTINFNSNLTLKTNASMAFALGTATTTGGGVNSYVNVSGDLALLSNNIVSIAPMAPLSAGPYRLIDYSGSLSGLPIGFTNTTRYSLGLDSSTANQINLTNGGGSPMSLTWSGANAAGGTNWDLLNSANWNSQSQKFYQFDSVTFDAGGVTTNINIVGLLYPQSMMVNDTRAYLLGGTGKISGNAGITKNNSGTLWITNTGGNDFNGAIAINAGILKINRADAFGSTNGNTTIASGAMLDLNGTSASSPGEFVTISGNGITNGGAIINTGADQQNGLRYVNLAADASIGNYPGRWDIRGSGGNSSFSGGLFLNGFTLTKTGGGKNEFADTICTNGGSLVNSGGILAFTRSIIDGPGTVTILGTNMLQLENNSTGTVAKPFIFRDTSVLQLVGNSFVLSSPVTNLTTGGAGLTVDVASGSGLTLTNVLSGSGALTKISSGVLTLQAPDLCTGPTVISAGSLVLTNAASLAATPSITLSTNTILDATGVASLALGSSQTLAGSGAVLGNVTTATGATLDPGGHPGPLTISGDLTQNNTTNLIELGSDSSIIGDGMNDLIAVGHNLNLSGLNTLRITPLAALDTAAPYTVMTYSNTLTGGPGNLTVVSGNPRYIFSVVNPATTPNSIQVSVTGIPVELLWHGGAAANPNLWDSGITSNWLNGATADVFYPGDTITFDDTATTGAITLPAAVVAGSMLIDNNSLNYTVTGAGSLMTGSLTKQGSGSFTMNNTGPAAFQFGLSNLAGNLTIYTTNFSAPSGIFLNGGTLGLNLPTNLTVSAKFSDDGTGAGTFQKLGAGVLTLSGYNSNFNGAMLVSTGTLKPANASALGASTVNGVTVASGATLDVNGQNLGAKPVTVSGAGVGSLGAIYNSGGGQNNALLNVTLASDTTFGGTGRWDIRTQTINGTPYNATLSTGGQPYNLTKVGSNQCSLVSVGVDDLLGNIDVQQGIFDLEGSTMSPGTGMGDASKTLTVRGGAMLEFYDLANPLNKVVSLLDGSAVTNAHGANIISGGITLNGTNTFAAGTSTLSLNGANSLTGYALNGSGTVIQNGTGTLNLYSANNFSSPVYYLNGGNLAINDNLSLTANKVIQVSSTAGGSGLSGTRITLGISAGGAWTVPPGVSVNLPSAGGPTALRSGLYANKGTSEWQGPISFYQPAGATNPGTAWMASDASNSVFTISGSMSGVLGTLSIRGDNQGIGKIYGAINYNNPVGQTLLEKTGQSFWTIYTNYNVWGDTLLHQGTLQLGTNNACPVTGLMTIGQQNHACVLDLNGFNQQVSGLASDPAYQTNQFVGNSSPLANSTLTILGTNITTFAGTIMDQAVLWEATNSISGSQVALTLASANTGSLTLSGDNAYTGPTLVNGGTLLVNGSLSNTVVNVNLGATLGGTGLISGPVTVNTGGTLALGPAIGTLTIATNLTLRSGATNVMKLNLNSMTIDRVAGVSNLTYGGTLVITNTGTTQLSGGTSLKLFDAAVYSGAFAGIIPAKPGPGMDWDTTSLPIDGTLKVLTTTDTSRTNLSAMFNGSQLTLTWPASHIGWSLQSNAVSVANPNFWFAVPNSADTNQIIINVNPAASNVYYRMSLQP